MFLPTRYVLLATTCIAYVCLGVTADMSRSLVPDPPLLSDAVPPLDELLRSLLPRLPVRVTDLTSVM